MAGNIRGITIELNGDTSKLDKALKNVNNNAKDLNKQLKDVNTSLKFNPGNTELITQKQRILGESISNTKEKLEMLKTAQEQARQALENGELGQDEYDALTREVLKCENQLKSFEKQLGELKKPELTKTLNDMGEKFTDIGKNVSTKVSAPLGALAATSMVAFNTVDEGLDTIVTKTGATGEAMQGLQESFSNVFQALPSSASAVGEAIGEINTQFGLLGTDLENASVKLLKFCEINGSDVTQTTIQAKEVLERFGLSAKELPMVLDALTATAQGTGQGVDTLAESVRKFAPQLKDMGLSVPQAVELLGRMEQAGIDSSKAMSYLTKAQIQLAKDGEDLQSGLPHIIKCLREEEDAVTKLEMATYFFGTKGGREMIDVLESGALDLDEFAEANKKCSGVVESTWDGIQDPIDKLSQLKNVLSDGLNELATSLQDVLAPAFDILIEGAKALTEGFKNLPEPVQTFIAGLVAFGALIGPVILGLGQLCFGLSNIIGFFSGAGAGAGILSKVMGVLNLKFALIAAAILAVIAVGVLLYQNWDEIKAYAEEKWEAIKTKIVGVWEFLKGKVTEVWGNIKTTISNGWNTIKTVTSSVWEGVKGVLTSVWEFIKGLALSKFNEIKNTVTTIWNALKTVTSSVWEGIKGVLTTVWNWIKTTAQQIFEPLKNTIKNVWETIKTTTSTVWNSIKSTISGIWNGIKNTCDQVWTAIKNSVTNAWNNLKSTCTSIWNGVKDAISKPIQKARDTVQEAINKVKSILNTTLSFPKIKLPKFNITGSFSLNPPSVPKLSVSWHKKGGIFNNPTLLTSANGSLHGVGEAGAEAIIPLEKLKDYIREVMSEQQQGVIINIENMRIRDDSDLDKLAQKVNEILIKNARKTAII